MSALMFPMEVIADEVEFRCPAHLEPVSDSPTDKRSGTAESFHCPVGSFQSSELI